MESEVIGFMVVSLFLVNWMTIPRERRELIPLLLLGVGFGLMALVLPAIADAPEIVGGMIDGFIYFIFGIGSLTMAIVVEDFYGRRKKAVGRW